MKLILSVIIFCSAATLYGAITCPPNTIERYVSYQSQHICVVRCENCDSDSTATLELGATTNPNCTSMMWHYSGNLGSINTVKMQIGMALMVKTNSNLILAITGCGDQAGTSMTIKNIEIR
jgi:hypothetical protein